MAECNDVLSEESSSSDDDSIDEIDDISSRRKRHVSDGISWCGVEGESTNGSRLLVWPPKTEDLGKSQWVNLRPVQINQPKFGNKMQLYSRTRHNIGVYYDGVRGTQDDNDLHTFLELSSAGPVGHVRIQGMLTKYYVAMDNKGRLYSEANRESDNTIFIESIRGLYNQYLSAKYNEEGWYVGIKKNGKFKRGRKTKPGQKATQFLPRRRRFE